MFRDETSLASRRAQLRWRLGEFLRLSKPREVFKESIGVGLREIESRVRCDQFVINRLPNTG